MLRRSPSGRSARASGARLLLDRQRLAGERRLLDLELRRFDQAQVGRHDVARLQQHHVAGHQLAPRRSTRAAPSRSTARLRRGQLLAAPPSRARRGTPARSRSRALSTTITTMAMVSSGSPITPAMTAAASSTRIMKSVNCRGSMASGRRRPRLLQDVGAVPARARCAPRLRSAPGSGRCPDARRPPRWSRQCQRSRAVLVCEVVSHRDRGTRCSAGRSTAATG